MQTRFIKFKDTINSSLMNERLTGILEPAVYRGFDLIENANGLTFLLNHSLTGELFVKQDLTFTARRAVLMTKQGVVIKEDSPVPITLDINTGNASYRNDILVLRHNHDTVYPGGIAANYEIIKGPLGSDSLPTINNPENSLLIGVFRLAPNAQTVGLLTWTRSRIPSLGGKNNSRIDEINRFTHQQQDFQFADTILILNNNALGPDIKRVIENIDQGNTFIIEGGGNLDLVEDKPAGTEIDLLFISQTTIRNFTKQLDGENRIGYGNGLRGISIGQDYVKDLIVKRGQIIKLIKVFTPITYNVTTDKIFGDYWQLVSVSDSPLRVQELEAQNVAQDEAIVELTLQIASLQPKPYTISEIFLPDVGSEFILAGASDTWGKGKADSIWAGYCICNGNFGTPDKRKSFPVGYDKDDSEYNTPGLSGSSNQRTLTLSNIPPHRHSLFLVNSGKRFTGAGGADELNSGQGNTGWAGGQNNQTVPFDNRPQYNVCLFVMRLPV